MQQLREAFPFDSAPQFLIFDRDAKYGEEVPAAVRSLTMSPVRTSFASPWQNGIAERWVGSCRRELLDHVIPLDERHMKRLLGEYISYHHDDRTHLGLGKETPNGRTPCMPFGRITSQPRLGGLHHSPGGKELYSRMQHYLSTARDLYARATDGEDLKNKMIQAFPDYGGAGMLDQQKLFLFPGAKKQRLSSER